MIILSMQNELKKVKFVQLRSEGQTFKEISEQLEVSKPTLIAWSKELQHEIHNQTEFIKEEIRKEFDLTTRRKIEIKAKLINKIEESLLEADFSRISKQKAIQILLNLLNEQTTELSLKEKGPLIPDFDYVSVWTT